MTAYVTTDVLEAGLPEIFDAPADLGTVELIVCRPTEGAREVLEEGVLDVEEGLVGDDWRARVSSHTPDGSPHPGTQLTLMSSRVMSLIARERDLWPLAGDQLYVDLDLRPANLPVGARLEVGSATVEVTDVPHTGCAKFRERFGSAAIRFVNSPGGRERRLRGMYVRIVTPGTVRPGDTIRKL
jgi:MOSC domain